jgi:Homing endonuclease associated repeat
MTREEIIAVVRECTATLGHAPTRAELEEMGNVGKHVIRKNFGSHRRMLAASGVEAGGPGYPISTRSLFLEWARIARSQGKVPRVIDYQRQSKYSVRPLFDRFGNWRDVAAGMLLYARQEGLQEEWKDVLDIIAIDRRPARSERRDRTTSTAGSSLGRPRLIAGQPTFGRPLTHSPLPLSHAPTNEAGVVLLFGSMARALGYLILRAQAEFPDCQAMREIEPNRWQLVRIEFEYESRNFLEHKHAETECDLIVCWSHNWPECPLEVLELQSLAESSRVPDLDATAEAVAFQSRVFKP